MDNQRNELTPQELLGDQLSEVTKLRQYERKCLDVIASIRRKLELGSQAVSKELLLTWEKELNDTRAKLTTADELPAN